MIHSLLWNKPKLWITRNFWNLLKFFNNFVTFSAEFCLLFIFEFPSYDPRDFTEQFLAYIYRVSYVVKKVLILAFWFKLYLHCFSHNNESILSLVMPIFWCHVSWFFFLIILREKPVILIFKLSFHIWHTFMSIYLKKECILLQVKAKFCSSILWFYFFIVIFLRFETTRSR